MRKSFLLFTSLFFIFFPLIAGLGSEDQTNETLYFQANQAYNEGRFQGAVDGYIRLVENGYRNGHLYYNLGNANFRLNRLGRAVLYYERARLFIPRDRDLNFNLRYARDQTQDVIPDSRGFVSQTFFWLDNLSLVELMWAFAILNIFFWGLIGLRLFIRPEWAYYVFILLLICWSVSGVSFGMKWYQVETDDRAVVLVEEVEALAGPHSRDIVHFKLHEGALVHLERTEAEWSLIQISNEKRGWVKSESIEEVVK